MALTRLRSTGMTVALLHPLPLDGSVWSEETRTLVPDTLAPTLYDFGDSIESWASGVLDAVASGPLVVVGNSIGGSCAIEVARLAPERVRLIVLVGAKAGHRPEPEFRDEALRVLETDGMTGAWPRYWAPLFARTADPQLVERARNLAFDQPIDAIIRGVRVFHSRPDRSDFVTRLEVPVLIVRARHDRIIRNGAASAAGLRHGTVEVVEGAGHYVPLERPAYLAAILRQAIDELASFP